jgi:predicted AAA+ superfamily ATPase
MFPRLLHPPGDSFFLFGARGTGKTTWIGRHFADAAHYDLLLAAESLRLSREPGILTRECSALPDGAWVVIDEVQRVPAVLDEVQHLMTRKRLRFVLSGSSARKLRRGGANMLAGRAEVRNLFPLVSAEAGLDRELDEILRAGMLPLAVTRPRPHAFLKSYCEVYLKEEVQAEALVRQIGPFHRFLEVAARVNGQTVNVAGVARDAGIARQTAQEFFQILVDTLLATWLPAWKLKPSVKQVAHPKFYFFDTGVVRHLAGVGPLHVHPEERGFLLETFVLHELRAYLHYRELDYKVSYWRTHGGAEVDFFVEAAEGPVAIEVKSGVRWDERWNASLLQVRDLVSRPPTRLLGVYAGARPLLSAGIDVLPWRTFCEQLWADGLIR